jgi:hypothetical protein
MKDAVYSLAVAELAVFSLVEHLVHNQVAVNGLNFRLYESIGSGPAIATETLQSVQAVPRAVFPVTLRPHLNAQRAITFILLLDSLHCIGSKSTCC